MFPLAALGMGMSLLGGIMNIGSSREMAESQMREAMLQRQIQEQNHKSMMLEARRKSLEILRTQQRAQSIALQSATNQGAAFGSGLQGGYGQISGQTATNLAGVNQNLQIGENVYQLNDQISREKIHQAQLGGQMAMNQGIMSLGGSVMNTAGPLGNMMKGWGSTNNSWGNSNPYDWGMSNYMGGMYGGR